MERSSSALEWADEASAVAPPALWISTSATVVSDAVESKIHCSSAPRVLATLYPQAVDNGSVMHRRFEVLTLSTYS